MTKETVAVEASSKANGKVWSYVALAWIVPGGGHFAQRRWARGAILAACVVAMFLLGLAMRGKLYQFNTGDIVETAGWVADLGAAGLYYVARFLGYDVPEPSSATGDYGTKFLLTAGLLNVLVMTDAYDLATGKKS